MKLSRSERVWEGKLVAVRVDQAVMPDGRRVRWEVVEHRPSVGIVPVRADGTVVFVEQYRHPTGGPLLELPAGNLDGDEAPLAAARRELAEEIGCRAAEWVELGGFYLAPGWTDEYMHVFLARDLSPAAAEPDVDERITVVELPWEELQRRVRAGEIQDCKSLAALVLAEAHLNG